MPATLHSETPAETRHESAAGAIAPGAAWHTLSVAQAMAQLGAGAGGLSSAEAQQRLKAYGPNTLEQEKTESIVEIFLEEIREPMVLLLLVTGVLYSLWGKLEDAITIFAVIVTLATVEVLNERRAKKAIAGLRKLAEPTALVRRDARPQEIPVIDLTVGDVLLLEAGRRLPADARLVEAYGLAADESSLTGESVPVDKQADAVLEETAPLAERRTMVFSGSLVTRGRGSALVVATGMQTELGHIAGLTRSVKQPRTPLQLAMSELSRSLVGLALGFSVIIPLLGILGGQPVRQMLLTGLSLAFATIPEEMPIIITMVLALGAYRLSRQNAIVKRLRAVEALGAVTVIATDKTGTVTENRMEVSLVWPEDAQGWVAEIGVLCNDAVESGGDALGDPLETALLRYAGRAGLDLPALRRAYRLRNEFTFDNARKMMSVVYEREGGLWAALKGAPEAILAQAARVRTGGSVQALGAAQREAILAEATAMAGQGLRVIAFAEKTLAEGHAGQAQVESELTFVGLAGLADPPRPEVKAAIQAARGAGIRPIMITGDHALTAAAIAGQVGLAGDGRVLTGSEIDALSDDRLREAVAQTSLFARATPEHKLRIVIALQERGERVAVTGDGVNDAPALAAADIGVAMGETGTDVAREAGDIVLADDNFATIVRAVGEGRILYTNLKKTVRYYLTCKVALISAMLLPVLLRVPVPFAPVQIILMELFMDLAASVSLVNEPPESDLMRQPPRDPRASFMDRPMIGSILLSSVGLFAAVSIAYLSTWYGTGDLARSQTVAFLTWLLGHVLLAFNMRTERQPLLKIGLLSNPLILIWAAATLLFVLVVALVPAVQAALNAVPPAPEQWLLMLALIVLGTFWLEAWKWLRLWRDARLP